MREGSSKPKNSQKLPGEKHPLLSFSSLSALDFSLNFSQSFLLCSVCSLYCRTTLCTPYYTLRELLWKCLYACCSDNDLNLGRRGKKTTRSTGESRGHPWVYTARCSLFWRRRARPTDGAVWQKDGKDFRRHTEKVGSSLYSCLV